MQVIGQFISTVQARNVRFWLIVDSLCFSKTGLPSAKQGYYQLSRVTFSETGLNELNRVTFSEKRLLLVKQVYYQPNMVP